MTLKTWMFEALFVTLFLLISLFFKDFVKEEIICSIAVLITFMHGQVADRMHEKMSQQTKPDVECYKFTLYYYVSKEVMWITYFYMIQSHAALLGAFIFLLYPLWRKQYRKNKPLKNDTY